MGRGKSRIIVTELPYMTNKSSLIERIATMARDEKIEGIVDLRDESDRQGMRIVIELSKNADPDKVLQLLHKYTPMQSTFSMIMLALVNGEPRLLSLKQALKVYVEHRLEIVRRRSEYELERARQREHILEGLEIAINNLDEVIAIIRKSRTTDTARRNLRRQFKISVIQANAILDMPLRRLSSLERKKIIDELKQIKVQIKKLRSLLRSPKKIRQVVSDELQVVKEAYGDRRRTLIVNIKKDQKKSRLVSATDLVPEKDVWIGINHEGKISRSLDRKTPRLSGSAAPELLIRANTRDTIYLVTESGEAAAIPAHALPEAKKLEEGVPFSQVSPLRAHHNLTALFALPPVGDDKAAAGLEDAYVVTVTEQGMVKKSALSELPGPSADTFTFTRVNEGDYLGWLMVSNGKNDILLVTADGMAIRFNEEDVRPMGLVAAGVMGIKLQDNDLVVGADLLPQRGEVFMIATHGIAKRVAAKQFPRQGRYGQGVVAWKLPAKQKIAGMTIGKGTTRITVHLTRWLPKTLRLDSAPVQGRTARGKAALDIEAPNRVTRISIPWVVPRPKPKRRSK
jgi:DNA gyrase subunit A